MCKFIEKNSLHHQHQPGYRKYHLILTMLIKLRNYIENAMKSGEAKISTFADYSKAFDTIDFDILLRKMHKLNFSRYFLH